MDREFDHVENTILEDWSRQIRETARLLRYPADPVLVRGFMEGTDFVACIRKLGGTVAPTPDFVGWALYDHHDLKDATKLILPEFHEGEVGIGDFYGLLEVQLDGERFLVLRTEERVTNFSVRPSLVVGGTSIQAVLRLMNRVKTVWVELSRVSRVRVFGSGLTFKQREPLPGEDLVLPADFKRGLLGYLDAFWRGAGVCQTLRLAPSRGVLFVGEPGTGKTQAIRHLIGRYPQCAFSIYTLAVNMHVTPDALFASMLDQASEDGRPTVIVLEDVDRLFEAGGVSPQLFLNAMDGLFTSDQPRLWIATSNDPEDIAPNILDRPGRFDRIFVFELPAVAERLTLLRRFSPWPTNPELLERVARDSEGLSGAHIRELCVSAALTAAEAPETYGDALLLELRRVREQHEQARRYDFGLGASRPAGFGRGVKVAEAGRSGRPAAGS